MRYAPLYVHSFVPGAPRQTVEATRFCQRYHRYEEIDNVPDKLRWCRHSKGLMQAEVAQQIGIGVGAYKAIEAGNVQRIPTETAQRLAQFYRVPVADFLDEYNLFLHRGQADCIRAMRIKAGLNRQAFAQRYDIPLRSLEAWENGKKIVSYKSWVRYFRGKV